MSKASQSPAAPQASLRATTRISQLDSHQVPNFKKALEEYDKKYTTLVDYLGIIGPTMDQILKAIESAKKEECVALVSQVLTRVPEIDKPSIAFSPQITEFCGPINQRVLSEQELI
jgi:hypothetical protein